MNSSTTQNIYNLLLVAVITGFVLPALLKFFDIIFTRKVNRDAEIRNKQLEIIEQLTKVIWEWRFLAKQVFYYGYRYRRSVKDNERFLKAIADYENRVWALFIDIKAIKSRAIVWYPESVATKIEKLYEYIKIKIDAPMTQLLTKSENQENDLSGEFFEWQKKFTEEVSPKIEEYILSIAKNIK